MAKEKSITIKAPFGQPMHSLCCDHYAIVRNGDFTDLDFLCERSEQSLSIRMATAILDNNRGEFLKYLSEVGIPSSPSPRQVHIRPGVVIAADMVGLSRHGASGEFTFHAISWQCALGEEKGPGSSDRGPATSDRSRAAFFVAFIRCRLETQAHWIGTLYES